MVKDGFYARLLAALVTWAALFSGAAAAQETSSGVVSRYFNIQNFRPDLYGGAYFAMPDTSSLGRWRFAGGLSLGYTDRPFTTSDDSEDDEQSLVDYMVTAEIFGSVGVTKFLSLGFSLPGYRSGGTIRDELDGEVVQTPYTQFAGGDLWVSAKAQLLDPKKRRLGIALLSEASYPASTQEGFGHESGLSVRVRTVAELELKRLRFAAHGGYRFRPTASRAGFTMADQIEYGAGARLVLREGIDAVVELAGLASSPLDRPIVDSESEFIFPRPVETLFGLRGASAGGLNVSVGGGVALVRHPGAPVFRFFVTLGYRMPPDLDIDRDGLTYRNDRCPTVPESANGIQDDDGCPEPDSDGDTLVDPVDACPTAAEDFDGFKDEDGCPELDNDGDGLEDVRDQCPTEAEDKNGIEDTDGCPEIDTDQDGIADRKDRCPKEPEDANGIEDEDGCPEHLGGGRSAAFDTDRDGVEDRADRCPLVPEDHNGVQDWDGCPEQDADGDSRPDDLDRCPREAEDRDGFEDDDGCPEPGGTNRAVPTGAVPSGAVPSGAVPSGAVPSGTAGTAAPPF